MGISAKEVQHYLSALKVGHSLVKESIHPFYDGNGRTGRILNILMLVHADLLELPILYLSRYINQTKPDYYRLLQTVREENRWEEWCIYLLTGISRAARSEVALIKELRSLMQSMKIMIRQESQILQSGSPQQPLPLPIHEDRVY